MKMFELSGHISTRGRTRGRVGACSRGSSTTCKVTPFPDSPWHNQPKLIVQPEVRLSKRGAFEKKKSYPNAFHISCVPLSSGVWDVCTQVLWELSVLEQKACTEHRGSAPLPFSAKEKILFFLAQSMLLYVWMCLLLAATQCSLLFA